MITAALYGIVDLLLGLMALYAIYLGVTLEQSFLLWTGLFSLAVVFPILMSVTVKVFRRYCRTRGGVFCPAD